MNKISNALIIDDKSYLLTKQNDDFGNDEYISLDGIKNFFLENSIPFSIINNLSDSLADVSEQIRNLPKPDLVVLDLDLNSNGDVDDYDIELLRYVLKEIYTNYGEFVLFIYSTVAFKWDIVKSEIVSNDNELSFLLLDANTIIQEKNSLSDSKTLDAIKNAILEKANYYYGEKNKKILNGPRKLWNKEILLFAAFFVVVLLLFFKSSNNANLTTLITSIIVILLVTIRFITPEKN